ncbi:MAG: 30S ribosomal protein S8 [Lentisphaerae bacterium]|nr:30S ribosomal protein S8 [Lentisphaerota bacterium]MBQ4328947.1 30S ribosomal protein S8 [Lentisphaeria bacterium]
MSMQDPIADMLTRIRNAAAAGLEKVAIPLSKEKKAIAEVLMEEGYLSAVSVEGEGVKAQVVVELKYVGTKAVIEGIERVSKSSCRVHCGSREIPRVRNGLGIVVLSTPKGIMSGRKAAKENVGGEILCRVW